MMNKTKLQRVLLCFCCVALVICSIAADEAEALCPIDPNGTYIEAEHFTGSYNLDAGATSDDEFNVVSDANAINGGQVLETGSGGYANNNPGKEVKVYEVTFTTAGDYNFWMRGEGYSGNQDSMFFFVDSDNDNTNDVGWRAWNFGGSYNSYIWTSAMQVGANVINIPTVGTYRIKIAMREPDTRIDGFYITQGGETPTDATVPAMVTTFDPQTNCPGAYWTSSLRSLGPTCFVGFDAAPMSFDLTNTGEPDSAEATVTSNQSWAVVGNDTVPVLDTDGIYTVNVSFNTSALAIGTHQAELTVTGDAHNSPFRIPVTLLVKGAPTSAACGEIPLYAQNLVNPAIMVQLDTSGSMGASMAIAQRADQETPDLKAIVQEIIGRTGWVENNAIAFIVSGTGVRRAWSFDGDPADAPKLTIKYDDASTGNEVTVERTILFSGDDVQVNSGNLNTNENFLQLGRAGEPVGLRFGAISVPPGATVSEAILSFTAYQGDTATTSLTIQGVNEDDVPDLTDLITASTTTNSVAWSPGSWAESMSRINIAEDVLKEVFLDRSIAWGFATWAGGTGNSGDDNDAPDYYTNYRIGVHEHDQEHQDDLQAIADDGSPSGWTPLAPSMRGGLEYFKGNRVDGHYNETYSLLSCQPRIVIMVTDGYGNTGTDNTKIDAVVDDLIAEGVSVVAVGFGLTNATQLQRIVDKMQVAGEANDEDYLYHLHNEHPTDSTKSVPFMAQNRKEFIDAMNNIVSNVKAQAFHGSSPAPTTSADNGEILLIASFDASDWTGNISATKFDPFTGVLEAIHLWETRDVMPASINGFIYDSVATGYVSPYTDASLVNDNFLCKPMGDIINSTPVIVGSPPYYYNFDSYLNFKYNVEVRARDTIVYVGANDGALHAINLEDGVEKWRFYPASVQSKMSFTESKDDLCSPAYWHKFLLDGSPEPADIFVDAANGWRTILTTGLGKGGSAFFTLDVTYGEDFDEPDKTVNGSPLKVASTFLWEFTATDDSELGFATSLPTIARVATTSAGATDWATYFGSGRALNEIDQIDKEAYLFAVKSWDKSSLWLDASAASTYHVKLSATELKNDVPSPPLVVDTQGDGYIADRVYLGNLYGDMYRINDIGFGDKPVSELLFDSERTDHKSPVTAKAGFAYAENDGDVWIYFGTGKYVDQIDKFTTDQQYFYGLFDAGAATSTAYKQTGLVQMKTHIIEAYAVDEDGNKVDLDGNGTAGDSGDLRKYRTLTCSSTSADSEGRCNPSNLSWVNELVIPGTGGSERVISQPLIVSGITFYATFIPDGDVCEGNGDTWLLAVDSESGEFLDEPVFDLNENGDFDSGDTKVTNGDGIQKVSGIYVGSGKPSGELAIHNDILFVGTTGQAPKSIKVNLPLMRAKLKSWRQVFN